MGAVAAADGGEDLQRVYALVRGVEREYAEAYDDSGRLVRPIELAEARLLLADARERIRRIEAGGLDSAATALSDAVAAETPAASVAARAAELRALLARTTGIAEHVFPPAPPSAGRGKALYADNCASCHGSSGAGDGRDASGLERRPPDFTDSAFMRDETPDDFFLVISLGRRQAAMPSWEESLSVQQRWDLVSYVWSLRDEYRRIADGERLFISRCARCHATAAAALDHSERDIPPLTALDRTASRSDAEIDAVIADGIAGMPGFRVLLGEEERRQLVAFVRVLSLGSDPSRHEADSLGAMVEAVEHRVDAAVDAYRMHEEDSAALAGAAYLAFEPLEPQIGRCGLAGVRRVEDAFVVLQKALTRPDAVREVDVAATGVREALGVAKRACRDGGATRGKMNEVAVIASGVMLVLALVLVAFKFARRRSW